MTGACRYDGVRYGGRQAADELRSMYGATRQHGLGAEVKRRIVMGTYALSAGYYDAFYKKAQQVRLALSAGYYDAFYKKAQQVRCTLLLHFARSLSPALALAGGVTEL